MKLGFSKIWGLNFAWKTVSDSDPAILESSDAKPNSIVFLNTFLHRIINPEGEIKNFEASIQPVSVW